MGKIVLIVLGVVVAAGYAWHSYNTVSMDVHYRLTITLDTPQGEVRGSTVRAISNRAKRYKLINWPEGGNPASERGEAVVVDMPNGKKIFGLIDWNSDQELFTAFQSDKGSTTYEGIKYYKSLPVGSQGTPYKRFWPAIVTFTDPKDPKTVRRVIAVSRCNDKDIASGRCNKDQYDQFAITENNLEKYFGKGVSIKSVTVEITDEDVTTGVVDRYLDWLGEYYNKRLDGNRFGTSKTEYPIANQFSAGAFSTGENK